jgi:hypothetical protein
MAEIRKGEGGNKLLVELDEVINYGISLLDFQVMLNKCHVPRVDRGHEARVWITYHNKPILEIGVEEIRIVLHCNTNLLDEWQKDTRIAINRYIMDHQQYINQLLH